MSRAVKLATRELTKLGCEVTHRDSSGVRFRLSRSVWWCARDTPLPIVRSVIESERRQAAVQAGEYIDRYPRAITWDRLEHGDFYVTKHCKERLQVMRDQGLTLAEVVAAALAPETVRVHGDKHLYCAGRIGVVVGGRVNGKYPLITVLWSTDDLWDLNPRPEKEGVDRGE